MNSRRPFLPTKELRAGTLRFRCRTALTPMAPTQPPRQSSLSVLAFTSSTPLPLTSLERDVRAHAPPGRRRTLLSLNLGDRRIYFTFCIFLYATLSHIVTRANLEITASNCI